VISTRSEEPFPGQLIGVDSIQTRLRGVLRWADTLRGILGTSLEDKAQITPAGEKNPIMADRTLRSLEF
jgi:hypothetical protein